MLAISIKSMFSDHWRSEKLALSRIYESSHWESVVESVERMLSCREPSSGYAQYISTHCGAKKSCPFTCKGRFYTSCGKKYTDQWVQRTVDELIDVSGIKMDKQILGVGQQENESIEQDGGKSPLHLVYLIFLPR